MRADLNSKNNVCFYPLVSCKTLINNLQRVINGITRKGGDYHENGRGKIMG